MVISDSQVRFILHEVISDSVAFTGFLAARFYYCLAGISLQFVAKIDFHVFASKESNSDPLIYQEYCNNYGLLALNKSTFVTFTLFAFHVR